MFADLERILVFLKRLNLQTGSDASAHSRWVKFWRDNPAVRGRSTSPSLGWVLEFEHEIVGFFGNLPRRYRLGPVDVRVSVATSWAVQKEFRSHTKLLSAAYFAQTDVDILMVTTAIKPTARIFSNFSSHPMPQADYGEVLFWVINSRQFLFSALLKTRIRKNLATVLSYTLSPLLGLVKALRIRSCSFRGGHLQVTKCELDSIDLDFDDLWRRKLTEKPRLFASRQAEDMRWATSLAALSHEMSLLVYRADGRLQGYILLAKERAAHIPLQRAKVIDLFVVDDDLEIMSALLAAAFADAEKSGCDVFEIIGFPGNLRALFRSHRPFTRWYPCHPFYFKALSAEMASTLQATSAWYPSPFDGDSFL